MHLKRGCCIVYRVCVLRLGIGVPLRPGDILFFSILMSHWCDNEDDIYCASLYFKADNIGLNDNSICLTWQEEHLLDVFNANKIISVDSFITNIIFNNLRCTVCDHVYS